MTPEKIVFYESATFDEFIKLRFPAFAGMTALLIPAQTGIQQHIGHSTKLMWNLSSILYPLCQVCFMTSP
jgi:hypothetical protein